ncbi:hypothetical protein C0J52_11368 [Blattella germanica]|nr:hypothetical protein C0J52_11368 [Blattella germanica]
MDLKRRLSQIIAKSTGLRNFHCQPQALQRDAATISSVRVCLFSMSQLFKLVATLVLGLTLIQISRGRLRTGVSKLVSDATNIFSINLLKEVFDKDPGNVVVSPVSLSTLLAIVHQAAASNTRKQLTQVLHAGPQALRSGYSDIILSIKRGLDILEPFKKSLKKDFLSQIETVNFFEPGTAAGFINEWIADNTHGRINDLIKPGMLSLDTKLILTNAIYFKNLWKDPFIEQYTKKGPFYKEDGTQVQVTMMHLTNTLTEGYIENLRSRWIEVPFQGQRYSMLIIVPSKNMSFEEMVNKFTTQDLTTIMENIKTTPAFDVYLSLPKFKLSTEINFIPTLMKLGLTDLFTARSDLPRLTGSPLYVNQVIQKAEIEVDEKGATGSAGTGIGVVAISAPAPFKVDRPFLFFVIDSVNAIPIFAGKVTDPSI